MVDKRQNEIIGRYEECKRIADKFGLQIAARDYLRIERNGTALRVFTQIDDVYHFLYGYQAGAEKMEYDENSKNSGPARLDKRCGTCNLPEECGSERQVHCTARNWPMFRESTCPLWEPRDYDDPNPQPTQQHPEPQKPEQGEPFVPEVKKRCGNCKLSEEFGSKRQIHCTERKMSMPRDTTCPLWEPPSYYHTKPTTSIS